LKRRERALRPQWLGAKWRIIERYQHMSNVKKRGKAMEIYIPLGLMAAWIILQAWVLPRFGVKT